MDRDEAVDKAIKHFLDDEDGGRVGRLRYLQALADLNEVAIRKMNVSQIEAVVAQIEARTDGPNKAPAPLAIAALVRFSSRLSVVIRNRAIALPADVDDPLPGITTYTPPQRRENIKIPEE